MDIFEIIARAAQRRLHPLRRHFVIQHITAMRAARVGRAGIQGQAREYATNNSRFHLKLLVTEFAALFV